MTCKEERRIAAKRKNLDSFSKKPIQRSLPPTPPPWEQAVLPMKKDSREQTQVNQPSREPSSPPYPGNIVRPKKKKVQQQTFSQTYKDPMSDPPNCYICLDEFTSPVSLPCGHVFCLGCIGEYWKINEACQCPLCKASFPTRPQLKTDQTLHTVEAPLPLKAGEVPCDVCSAKRPAVKSCLVCMASYCTTHLEAHYQTEELGRHLLVSVVKNLEDSVCKLHGKKLEKFCRSDRVCICTMCAQTEHWSHNIISISREALRRRTETGERVEEEITELQRRNAELEQLLKTEDYLLFLQRSLHAAL